MDEADLERLERELAQARQRIRILEEEAALRVADQKRLWKNLEIFRLLLDTVGAGVSILDRNDRFYLVNPAGERIFGVPPGMLQGRDLSDFVDEEILTVIEDHNVERRKGRTTSYDIAIRRPDGARRHLNVTATPLFDEHGELQSTLGIFRDITYVLEMEEELRTLRDEDYPGGRVRNTRQNFP